MSVTNYEDAQANYGDASPAKEIYFFTEKPKAENGDHEIRKGGSGLNVAVIRPGKHEHVGDEKGKQTGDSEPDVTGCENSNQNVKKLLGFPVARGADAFHSFAEQHIAERGEQNDEEKKNVSFQVQAWRIFHAI